MVNNCGVVVDGTGTAVLVDTTSTERRNRAVLAEVARVSAGAPKAVVNTHHHPDHTYGNGFLPAETLVIGHEQCRDEVLARRPRSDQGDHRARLRRAHPPPAGAHLRRPDDPAPARFPVELRHVGRAHTSNDVSSGCRSSGCCSPATWLRGRSAVPAGGLGRAVSARRSRRCASCPRGARSPVTARSAAARRWGAAGRDGFLRRLRRRGRRGVVRRRPDPAGGGAEASRQPLQTWAETERFVGNLHRAYSELSGNPRHPPLTVPSVWPDMVAFHGGPIACHA